MQEVAATRPNVKRTSRSREKKDYMTANLSRFNHKRDKSTSSHGSQSGKGRSRKEVSLYTDQEERLGEEYGETNRVTVMNGSNRYQHT